MTLSVAPGYDILIAHLGSRAPVADQSEIILRELLCSWLVAPHASGPASLFPEAVRPGLHVYLCSGSEGYAQQRSLEAAVRRGKGHFIAVRLCCLTNKYSSQKNAALLSSYTPWKS